MPVRPVNLPTAPSGNISEMAANMLAESAVWPSMTRQISPMAVAAEGASVTPMLSAQQAAPVHMMPNRAAGRLTPRRIRNPAIQPPPPRLIKVRSHPEPEELNHRADQQPAENQTPRRPVAQQFAVGRRGPDLRQAGADVLALRLAHAGVTVERAVHAAPQDDPHEPQNAGPQKRHAPAELQRDINDQRRSDERADHGTGVEHAHREGPMAGRRAPHP